MTQVGEKPHHWNPSQHAKEMQLKIFGVFLLGGEGDTTDLM